MTEEPLKEEKKEENPADPKKILAELDKKAAELPPVTPTEPSLVTSIEPPPVQPVEPSAATVEPATSVAAQPAVATDTVETSLPLITDAMRRLDDLLARFRGSA